MFSPEFRALGKKTIRQQGNFSTIFQRPRRGNCPFVSPFLFVCLRGLYCFPLKILSDKPENPKNYSCLLPLRVIVLPEEWCAAKMHQIYL